jgi:hypothetical protein
MYQRLLPMRPTFVSPTFVLANHNNLFAAASFPFPVFYPLCS